jgi:WD40 repeat protein
MATLFRSLALLVALGLVAVFSEPRAAFVPQVAMQVGDAVAFSRDGRLLATAGVHVMQLWDVATGRLVKQLPVGPTWIQGPSSKSWHRNEQEGPGSIVGFSPDGTMVMWSAVGAQRVLHFKSWNALPHVWNIRSGEFISGRSAWTQDRDQHPPTLEGFPWNGSQVGLWTVLNTESALTTLKDYVGPASAITPDGRFGASREGPREANTVSLWDLRTGQKLRTFDGTWRDILGLAISPSGRWVAMHANLQQEMIVWDASTGQRAATLPLTNRPDNFGPIAFSPDERWLAVQRSSGVALFDTQTWTLVQSIVAAPVNSYAQVATYAFSPDSKRMAFAVVPGGGLALWSIDEARVVSTFGREQLPEVSSLAISPDGTGLVVGNIRHNYNDDDTGALVVWDLASNRPPSVIDQEQPVQAVAFSPDGTQLAVGTRGTSRDGKGHLIYVGNTRLYDTRDWNNARPALDDSHFWGGSAASSQAVAFSPDGTRIASALLDIDHYQHCTPGDPCGFEDIPFIGLLAMWDTHTGAVARRQRLPDSTLNTLAFSPDGRWLATGHQDRLIKLYDARTGKRVRYFGPLSMEARLAFDPDAPTNPMSSVLSLAFASGGDQLVSGTEDGSVTVWNPATGTRIAGFREKGPEVRAVALVSITRTHWQRIAVAT